MTSRRMRRQRGAALVESAFCFMTFIMTLIGIMEFGRLVWAYTTVTDVAREGARFAACHGSMSKTPATVADIRTAVLNTAVGLDPNSLTVTAVWSVDNTPGSTVTVLVSYSATGITPFVVFPQLSSQSKMYISW